MVRTQFQPFAFRFDASRILALSTAIALHLLALLLLLIPLSRSALPPTRETPAPRWILPVSVPTPPVPVPISPPATPAPPTATHPLTPPATLAPPTAEAAQVALPAAEPSPPLETIDPGPSSISPPAPGATLQYLSAPAPSYPRAALLGRLQGTVLLQVRVDADGLPAQVDIARSSGHSVLDQAARQQVLRHWRFRPAIQDGQRIEAIGLVPIAFSLDN